LNIVGLSIDTIDVLRTTRPAVRPCGIALRTWLATQSSLLVSVEGKKARLSRHRSVILYVCIELALCARIEQFSIGTKRSTAGRKQLRYRKVEKYVNSHWLYATS
jgi:hypothetical protein